MSIKKDRIVIRMMRQPCVRAHSRVIALRSNAARLTRANQPES